MYWVACCCPVTMSCQSCTPPTSHQSPSTTTYIPSQDPCNVLSNTGLACIVGSIQGSVGIMVISHARLELLCVSFILESYTIMINNNVFCCTIVLVYLLDNRTELRFHADKNPNKNFITDNISSLRLINISYVLCYASSLLISDRNRVFCSGSKNILSESTIKV